MIYAPDSDLPRELTDTLADNKLKPTDRNLLQL